MNGMVLSVSFSLLSHLRRSSSFLPPFLFSFPSPPPKQPPLAKGGKSAEDLILLVKVLSEHEVTTVNNVRTLNGQLVYQFLEAFWPYEEYEDVKSREYYQAAVDYLSAVDTLELSTAVPWTHVPFNQLPRADIVASA